MASLRVTRRHVQTVALTLLAAGATAVALEACVGNDVEEVSPSFDSGAGDTAAPPVVDSGKTDPGKDVRYS